ncbi:MAG: peptidoglycan DD-metalloendopeptidase family protein [Ruminococcus sp.]|uniref:murein hydrolase activator EnvC family protein n=1 Tax=Ruminococcus sp. TaxID=41978 RepID=UPI0025D403D5|nr:M23 family metallopeptidase [Ruminococcus sp.]MBR5681887.1 peptidoglycan DD-metalloendopeptidase family protein [Ruminococcus sp.]
MKKLSIFKKGVSFVISSALSVSLLAAYPSMQGRNEKKASALTIAEMQEEINNNKAKIAELQGQLDALEGNKAEEQQYQAILMDQIDKIHENINLLNQEIDSINADIDTAKFNIEMLENSIANQEEEINHNVEIFKQRLCNMYISGNENLASVVVGTSSFYDMISRVEMVNRIASYDEQLINDILADIDEMEQSKKNQESEKLTLQMKMEEQEKRKEEKKAEMEVLNEQMLKTQAEIDRIAAEQQRIRDNQDELAAIDAEFDAQIQAEIARQAAEAERRYQEEQARLAAQRAQAIQNYDYSNQPSYVPVSAGASGFAWPAPGFSYISSYYGSRWGGFHGGIDVGDAGIHGGAAVASRSGTVITVYNSCPCDYAKDGYCPCGGCGNYGNHVIISHDGTYSTVYAHLQSACVSVGQYVEQGTVIGYIGTTGWSTGPHLHFEVRVGGSRVDPMGYVSPY